MSHIIRRLTGLLLALGMALCAGIAMQEYLSPLAPLPAAAGETVHCRQSLSTNSESLTVYMTDATLTSSLTEALCDNPVVKRQFGDVSVFIGQNDYDTFRYINHGIADLALIKGNILRAFEADAIYGYERIASYPDYSAYLISLREKPTLSKEYLLGKIIGLLDYPSSRSGHSVPKKVLTRLGLTDNSVNLQYYNSHQELRRALLAGEVDIISSYWGAGDDAILSKNYITPLTTDVSGMEWYLKLPSRNTDLTCAIQAILSDIAAQHPNSYYQNVSFSKECRDGQ
ncbi:hypothetical protein [Alteromonas sp. CYL-A6]|uniref:hypothetical protein n=1 Tax=Alteromonas nitratireducens TaxID=3390813 RepID=UPI0034C353A7